MVKNEVSQPETPLRAGDIMGKPTIEEKRWTIDLEKRIQESHYADSESYSRRYSFNPNSGKEIFVVDTPPPYPSGTWHIGAVAQYSIDRKSVV